MRDYALWSSRRMGAMPGRDMTRRVLALLENEGRRGAVAVADAVASLRIAHAAAGGTYVVTSAIGNFVVGRQGARWLVISLPGD